MKKIFVGLIAIAVMAMSVVTVSAAEPVTAPYALGTVINGAPVVINDDVRGKSYVWDEHTGTCWAYQYEGTIRGTDIGSRQIVAIPNTTGGCEPLPPVEVIENWPPAPEVCEDMQYPPRMWPTMASFTRADGSVYTLGYMGGHNGARQTNCS